MKTSNKDYVLSLQNYQTPDVINGPTITFVTLVTVFCSTVSNHCTHVK